MTFEERTKLIASIVEDKKGEDVEVVDVRGSDYFVDGVIIATTMASKHALSLVAAIKDGLKPETFYHVDESDDWTIIDLGDLLIHLMSDEYRRRYNIEEFLRDFSAKKGR
jgi:ribosome silencing factor RsfS/YbeB/iojap